MMTNTTLNQVCIGGGSYGIAASGVDYSPELPTYLRITDINDDGTLDTSALKSVNDKKSWKYKLKPNDIVFARTGASTGRNYFYDERDGEFVYAGFLIKFSLDPTKINPLFVKYYCQTESYWNWIQAFDTGGTRGNINAKDLGNMPLPTIQREQQDTIADVLSSLDDRIRLLKQENKTIDALLQTYFRKWFLDDNNNELLTVSDIATLENNSVNPSSKPLEPFFHYSIPSFDNNQTPQVELGKSILSNKFVVLPNTILVSKLNPGTPRVWRIGESVQQNSICSTEFQVLKPKNMRQYTFLYCLMKSRNVVESFAMSATGTSGSHQRIRPEYILEVETPKPDEQMLSFFNEISFPMMEKVKKNKSQILTLQKLHKSLLPKLFSGEISVKK